MDSYTDRQNNWNPTPHPDVVIISSNTTDGREVKLVRSYITPDKSAFEYNVTIGNKGDDGGVMYTNKDVEKAYAEYHKLGQEVGMERDREQSKDLGISL